MPTNYTCDNCSVTAASLAGWLITSVRFLRDDQTSMSPPYSRTEYGSAPDLLFHSVECQNAWCTKAGVPAPAQPA